ncbi:hypothetical protein QBC36DRAFT_370034 [Triangularia setosa]|uniref:Uncharacterized protein n=1 Tax=Triangularia setosa TaxID=2587417 RepID=A0AAN6VWQ3_9PEZI|nr:hypothetical protein QBC36DRAFT_370034 [Podospora setosa]
MEANAESCQEDGPQRRKQDIEHLLVPPMHRSAALTLTRVNPEFQDGRYKKLPYTSPYGCMAQKPIPLGKDEIDHGPCVSSKLIGKNLKAGRDINMILLVYPYERFEYINDKGKKRDIFFREAGTLEMFLRILNEILDPSDNKVGRAVVNYSRGLFTNGGDETLLRMFCRSKSSLSLVNSHRCLEDSRDTDVISMIHTPCQLLTPYLLFYYALLYLT